MVDIIYWDWCLDTLRWDCRFTLAIVTDIFLECRFILGIMYDGVCDVPFHLAIYEDLFGAFRILDRVQGLCIDTTVLESDLRIYVGRGPNNQDYSSPDGAWDVRDCPSEKWDMLNNYGPGMWHNRMWACDSLLLLIKVCLGYVTTKMWLVSVWWWWNTFESLSFASMMVHQARVQLATRAHRRIPFRLFMGAGGP